MSVCSWLLLSTRYSWGWWEYHSFWRDLVINQSTAQIEFLTRWRHQMNHKSLQRPRSAPNCMVIHPIVGPILLVGVATGKVRGSSKPLLSILWASWISVLNFMVNHPIVDELSESVIITSRLPIWWNEEQSWNVNLGLLPLLGCRQHYTLVSILDSLVGPQQIMILRSLQTTEARSQRFGSSLLLWYSENEMEERVQRLLISWLMVERQKGILPAERKGCCSTIYMLGVKLTAFLKTANSQQSKPSLITLFVLVSL